MESMLNKFKKKFKQVRESMERWDELQSRLISQFINASSIVERLQIIQDPSKYGTLKDIDGISHALLIKRMESLQSILLSINKTLEEFGSIVVGLETICRDGRKLVKGTVDQLQQRIGIKPSLAYCIDGLTILYDMHRSEYVLKSSLVSALSALTLKPRYVLKSSLVSALSALTLKPSSSDLGVIQQLLVDQPNIPKEEVQLIFDIIFADEI